MVGKPEPALFRLAAGHRRAAAPLVVGDRLDTDIEGAVRAGMDSLLVLTGVSTPADVLRAAPARAADLRRRRPAVDCPHRTDAVRVPAGTGDQAVAGGWRVDPPARPRCAAGAATATADDVAALRALAAGGLGRTRSGRGIVADGDAAADAAAPAGTGPLLRLGRRRGSAGRTAQSSLRSLSRSPKLALTDTRPDAQARGEVELPGDQREQVVAGQATAGSGPSGRRRRSGRSIVPSRSRPWKTTSQVPDLAGQRPVQVDPGGRVRVGGQPGRDVVAAPAGTASTVAIDHPRSRRCDHDSTCRTVPHGRAARGR